MAAIYIFVGGMIIGGLLVGLFVDRWIRRAKEQWQYELIRNNEDLGDIQIGMTDPPD